MFEYFKKTMTKEFEMIDIGLMVYYLGIEVKQMEDEIFISQEGYVKDILEKFETLNSNPVNTPIEYRVWKLENVLKIQELDPQLKIMTRLLLL